MITLTSEQRNILARRHNMEFYYVVEVLWPDGRAVYGQYLEPGVQPLLLSVGELCMQGRADGAGMTGSVNVKLNDAYGIFRDKFDHFNLHNTPAAIYLRAYGTDLMVGMFQGRIRNPIRWNEGDRTMEFEINSGITKETVGYTPDMNDVIASETVGQITHNFVSYTNPEASYSISTFISSEFFRTKNRINTASWPNTFGYARGVKVEPIANSPVTRTTKETWDITGGYGLIRSLELQKAKAVKANAENAKLRKMKDNGDYDGDIEDDWTSVTYTEAQQNGLEKKQYIDPATAPQPTGKIIIPVEDPELFEGLEKVLVEIGFNNQIIVCWAKFTTLDPNATLNKGYMTIDLQDFDLPIYENLLVFSEVYSDPLAPEGSDEWPVPLTIQEKRDIMAMSFEARTRERTPDYLNYKDEPISEALEGSNMEAFTKFILYGAVDTDGNFIPIEKEDYPWLQFSFVEVEVATTPEMTPADPSLDVPQLDPSLDIPSSVQFDPSNPLGSAGEVRYDADGIAYAVLQVIDQNGFECIVHNPYKHKFSKIRAVRKNALFQREHEDLAISPTMLMERDPGDKRGVVPCNASVRLFNWLPEQQYVVDTKTGTEVLAVMYTNDKAEFISLPPGAVYSYDADMGTLWAGYHPPCTCIALSYNGMIRRRFSNNQTGTQLIVDTINPYQTDEDIVKCMIDCVNNRPENWTYTPLQFKRSATAMIPRPNFFMFDREVDVSKAIAAIAFQNGKVVRNYGNLIELVDFMHEQAPVWEFDESQVIAQSVRLGLTQECKTLFNLSFSFNDTTRKAIEVTRKYNIPRYGQYPDKWNFQCYSSVDEGLEVAEFWMMYHSNIWRTISFVATFESLGLEIFDTVSLKFKQPITFSPVYEQVVGENVVTPVERVPIDFNPTTGETTYKVIKKQFPLYNVNGIITNMQFNVEDGTIAYDIWLPILAGEVNKCPQLWENQQ